MSKEGTKHSGAGDGEEADDHPRAQRGRANAPVEAADVERAVAVNTLAGVPHAEGAATLADADECGYRRRQLRTGAVDFIADHDGFNNPDESVVAAHVRDYRARRDGYVSG